MILDFKMPSDSHSYPPQQKEPETLYSKSVHSPLDKKHSKRRSKYSQVTDPSKVTYCILILALLYWLLPIPSPFSIYKRSTRNNFLNNCCNSNSQLESIRMPGWQKTFTLSSSPISRRPRQRHDSYRQALVKSFRSI